MPRSTSGLAIGAFLTGIVALALSTTGWFLCQLALAHPYEPLLGDASPDALRLAARIVLGISFAAAIVSGVFSIGARSSIAEGQGAVGGRGFYHVGVLLSLASAAGALTVI